MVGLSNQFDLSLHEGVGEINEVVVLGVDLQPGARKSGKDGQTDHADRDVNSHLAPFGDRPRNPHNTKAG